MLTTMTTKGQVTIPKQIRDALDLKPGTKIDFSVDENGNVLLHRAVASRKRKADKFEATRGKADIKWRTADLMALLRG